MIQVKVEVTAQESDRLYSWSQMLGWNGGWSGNWRLLFKEPLTRNLNFQHLIAELLVTFQSIFHLPLQFGTFYDVCFMFIKHSHASIDLKAWDITFIARSLAGISLPGLPSDSTLMHSSRARTFSLLRFSQCNSSIHPNVLQPSQVWCAGPCKKYCPAQNLLHHLQLQTRVSSIYHSYSMDWVHPRHEWW